MSKIETFTYNKKSYRDSTAIWFLTNKNVQTMTTEANEGYFNLSVEYKEI